MQRLMMCCGFSALLLVAGLYAGQAVHSVSDDGVVSGATESSVAEFGQTPFESDVQKHTASAPVRTVSSESLTSESESEFTQKDSSGETAHPTTDAAQPTQQNSPGHRRVLELIGRIFPNADPDTADVWASVYADMDPSEVEFILEQRKQLSDTLSAPGWEAFRAGSSFAAAEMSVSPESVAQTAAAVNVIKNNLRGTWSIGFRRTVVLPEVVPALDSMPLELQPPNQFTMFVCFDPGHRISSPLATHVALPANDGSLMFRLEGNVLTRRGDFQLLPGRRLGLITSAGIYAIVDSPAIPENASRIRITASGEIQHDNAAGESTVAGQVSVVRVADLAGLSTRDGVIFTTNSAESVVAFTSTAATLTTNHLEISNVDPEEEGRLLEQLNSQRGSSGIIE